jgi:hypothetical protein
MAELDDYEAAIDESLAELGEMPPLLTTVDIETADKAPFIEKVRERQNAWGEAMTEVVRTLAVGPDEIERLRAKVERMADEPSCAYCTHPHAEHMHDNPRRLCRQCMCTGYELPAGSG